jgi:hypothetical protein
MARAITPTRWSDEPVARFAAPICVLAAGLPTPMLDAITARMVDVAHEAGVRLGGHDCQPNVAVLFVDDGSRELADLSRRHPAMFANLDRRAIKRIAAAPGPVHVVSTTQERGSQGDPIFVGIGGERFLTLPFATRVVLPIRRDITSAVVLIDRRAIVGLTPRQIADYAAMRSFAMLNPDGAAAAHRSSRCSRAARRRHRRA